MIANVEVPIPNRYQPTCSSVLTSSPGLVRIHAQLVCFDPGAVESSSLESQACDLTARPNQSETV